MSNNFPIAKLAVHAVASLGVTKVVNDFISANTSVVTTADAVKVWTGRAVLGLMVMEHASKYLDERMDAAAAWWVNRKDEEPPTK